MLSRHAVRGDKLDRTTCSRGVALKVLQFITDSLGDASYLVVANGKAAAVDPQRDVRPLLAAAKEHNATIEFVFEPHVQHD